MDETGRKEDRRCHSSIPEKVQTHTGSKVWPGLQKEAEPAGIQVKKGGAR